MFRLRFSSRQGCINAGRCLSIEVLFKVRHCMNSYCSQWSVRNVISWSWKQNLDSKLLVGLSSVAQTGAPGDPGDSYPGSSRLSKQETWVSCNFLSYPKDTGEYLSYPLAALIKWDAFVGNLLQPRSGFDQISSKSSGTIDPDLTSL